jgi:DNA polymerase III epsilon subunit
MREIVLDTETTGLDPLRGDRLVEVGCIEIYNRMPTGQTFHRYINPERDMPAEAFAVHGLSSEFLSSKPLFTEVVEEFLEFIGDAPLVIHNASFDISFINAELDRIKRQAEDAAGQHAVPGTGPLVGNSAPEFRFTAAKIDVSFSRSWRYRHVRLRPLLR